MRVVIFIYSMSGGGAERVTANLANHWSAEGWDITVVTIAPRSMDFYELLPTVKRLALELDGASSNVVEGFAQNLRRVLALRRVLRKAQPDMALGMMTTANVLLALATRGMHNVRTVGSEHSYPPQCPLGAVWEWLRRHLYGRMDAVTALTSESADWLKAHTGARRVPVIPNAVLWPFPIQAPRISPASIYPLERHMLLAVGRIDTGKGFDWLVDVFTKLAQKHPDWDLVILGQGSQRPALRAQIQAAGLEKRIFLPGHVGNIGEWYKHAECYVMSSRYEGFPNTLVEAMAHGLPAISFDCDTGPRDIIRHEVDGFLVSIGDLAALSDALDRLMSDSALRQQLATKAVDARERFSMEKITRMWEILFNEVLRDR